MAAGKRTTPKAHNARRSKARRERRGDGGGRGGRRRRSPEELAQAEDFINRYTTGNPSEGFSSEEAVNYLRQVRAEAPPEVMQRAAVETVRNLPDDQRKAFAEMLQRRQAGSGMVTIERTGEARAAEGRGGSPAAAAWTTCWAVSSAVCSAVARPNQTRTRSHARHRSTRSGRLRRGRHARRAAGWSAWRRHARSSHADTASLTTIPSTISSVGCSAVETTERGAAAATAASGAGRRGRRDPGQPARQGGPGRHRRLRHERDDGSGRPALARIGSLDRSLIRAEIRLCLPRLRGDARAGAADVRRGRSLVVSGLRRGGDARLHRPQIPLQSRPARRPPRLAQPRRILAPTCASQGASSTAK